MSLLIICPWLPSFPASFLRCLLSFFLPSFLPTIQLPLIPRSSFALLCCHKKNSQETDSCFLDCSCKKAANPAAAALSSARISLLLVIYTGSYFRVFQIPSRIGRLVIHSVCFPGEFSPKFDLKNMIWTYLHDGVFMGKMIQIRQISKNFFFKSPGFFVMISCSR